MSDRTGILCALSTAKGVKFFCLPKVSSSQFSIYVGGSFQFFMLRQAKYSNIITSEMIFYNCKLVTMISDQ